MSNTEKKRIVDDILELLIQLTDDGAEVIQGLSEHTVRQFVAQEKVKSVRTGEGKRGKILVNKADLVAYFQK